MRWRAAARPGPGISRRSEEHTSELQSPCNLVCRLLLEKKKILALLLDCLALMRHLVALQYRHLPLLRVDRDHLTFSRLSCAPRVTSSRPMFRHLRTNL